MLTPLKTLALVAALATSALAESPIPAQVLVATDEVSAKAFTLWSATDPAAYAGTYSGDVGGDSTGKLTIKVGKAKKDGSPVTAAGSYRLAAAGMAPTVVTFENAIYWGDTAGHFTVGAFDLIFVKMGNTPGVIVGKVFIPRA